LPDDRPPLLLSAAAVAPARAAANADLVPVRRYAPPMVERRAGEPNALGWSAERRESREDVADGKRECGEFERMLSAVQQADAAALDEAALYADACAPERPAPIACACGVARTTTT
jgi:hypothetical protein